MPPANQQTMKLSCQCRAEFGLFQGKDGVTLIEMMIALVIVSMIAVGLLYGVMASVRLNYAAAQRAAAFSLCMELYEQMRGADYDHITPTNYPPQTVRMTHLGGSQRVPLFCQRTCQIVERDNPRRKEIEIAVRWVYQGKTLTERLNGMILEKR